jgi:hypothetical protein
MNGDNNLTTSWAEWPDELREQARSVVERMDNGGSTEALDIVDKMITDLNGRRATLAELANSLD